MPFSPLVEPYAELKAFKPGNSCSRNAGSLLKYMQSLQVCSIAIMILLRCLAYPEISEYQNGKDEPKCRIHDNPDRKSPERLLSC